MPDDVSSAGPNTSERTAPLLLELRGLWQELPGLIGARVQLLSLELQRAGLALAQMVALMLAATVLAITAWIALWVGAAAALLAAGLHLGWVLTLVFALNLAVAGVALRRVRTLAPLLALPATLRRLTVTHSAAPPKGEGQPAPPAREVPRG